MTDATDPIDAADTDTDDVTDTDASDDADATDAAESDATDDATDADCATDTGKSRKKGLDPLNQYLKSRKGSKGPGFLSLLSLLFIGLKLTGHIDWSWVWVLAPLWIKTLFGLALIAFLVYAHKKGWEPSGKT